MSEQINLNHVIGLIKSGEKAEAREILLNFLKAQRNNEEAWLYMAACAESKTEFEFSILQVLRINPLNNQAIRLAEQHGIRLPRQVKQARKQAQKNARRSRRQAAAAERRESTSVLRVLLLIVLVIIVSGVALFLTRQDKEETPAAAATEESTQEVTPNADETEEATEEATEVAIDETNEATEEVTEEATEEVTQEPTEEVTEEATEAITEEATEEQSLIIPTGSPTLTPIAPAATATPAHTPTRTPTPEPTLTATPSVTPVLQLVYDDKTAYIKNISSEQQDISELRFVQDLPSGEPVVFETADWQDGTFRGEGSIFSLQPDSCFQVGIEIGPSSAKPADCVRLNLWVTRGIRFQFWLLNDASLPTFTVMRGEEILAECEIAAGTCEFGFPE